MDYPYELHRVPGSQALEKFYELRKRKDGIPVILGNQEAFERTLQIMQRNSTRTIEELLELSTKITAKAWLKKERREDPEAYEIEQEPWPEDGNYASNSLHAYVDLSTKMPYPEVLLSIIPTSESWMVPCFLRVNIGSSYPKAEEHSAMFRYWAEKHSANIACVAGDVIECTVENPPTTKRKALELAREQFVYCPDIVYQGTGSLEMLAATLLNASTWSFWWD